MKNLFLLIAIVFGFDCSSQIIFENAYYIDDSGNRIDCLIKNVDWLNNPQEFEFKSSENSKVQVAPISEVKEFGVLNDFKYVRHEVRIDRSSDRLNELSSNGGNEFSTEYLFLNVLIDGAASLFSYTDGNLRRYFFSKDGSAVEPLLYKLYLNPNNKLAANDSYKQQLLNHLKCPDVKIESIKNSDYKSNDLIRLFAKYNDCVGSTYTDYGKKRKDKRRQFFHLNLRPGINLSSLSIRNPLANSRDNIDFDSELTLRFGVEAEFTLPFNKDKWAFFVEPTYQYYKSKKITNNEVETDYESLELPVGIRHYFFVNERSKLFLNVASVFDFSIDSKIKFNGITRLDIKSYFNWAIGAGYTFQNRYSIEFRHQFNRDILFTYSTWSSKYQTTSLILGYSLL